MLLLNSVAAVQPSPHSQLIGWKSAMMSSQNVIRALTNSLGATLNVTPLGRVTVCEKGREKCCGDRGRERESEREISTEEKAIMRGGSTCL
ncbi:hypothetical protein QQF64_007310 [Cirrhinus molitorella]|uniref:Uncharacterized protein n=1 Tax=Cirrhinus molitorella TaxID=172907 RepID=A0ABR3MBR2_9TELE